MFVRLNPPASRRTRFIARLPVLVDRSSLGAAYSNGGQGSFAWRQEARYWPYGGTPRKLPGILDCFHGAIPAAKGRNRGYCDGGARNSSGHEVCVHPRNGGPLQKKPPKAARLPASAIKPSMHALSPSKPIHIAPKVLEADAPAAAGGSPAGGRGSFLGFCPAGSHFVRAFSSQSLPPAVSSFKGNGFSALRTCVRWGPSQMDFFVCGLDPEPSGRVAKDEEAGGRLKGGDVGRECGGKVLPRSPLSAIAAAQALRPNIVLFGLGYMDAEKVFETFSREALLRSGERDPVEKVIQCDNGQFIPMLQQVILEGTPYYLVGRDRLVEMGALGGELLFHPSEFYSLVWKLISRSKDKEDLSRSLKKVLSEDSSEFCLLKIHQYLLEWTDAPMAAKQPPQEFTETTFTRKWIIGRNKSECQLRQRGKQFELARAPLPSLLKQKPNWKILVVCDAALEERLAGRLASELSEMRREGPRFKRMFELEDTSSTRFHLCLMLYVILPIATVCRFAWKRIKRAYLRYWVIGSTVTVSGDEVLSKIRERTDEESDEESEDMRMSNLEIVESRWMGLRHSVRDKSRD
ncbi:uncharacterized protein LOC34618335 [Cyclospora cayetanensis]|uniref:Uncharacterized protein LOC34618335 n=2 Tax=Cyclospora cayetanensis TaxID=88456 RepID=A0A6P5WE35_9EIME|nr:uncharacterized protein LOC34618335 [Cyclospora cayetanensis]OEH80036.1 hypothetical protein cyc_01310 [Cyclospora cayetanensis]